MRVDKTNAILPQAKELRRNMTPQERKLWYTFLKSHPIKFYRQRIIWSYIADFYCAKARLVIEIDGSQHQEKDAQEYDAERTRIMSVFDLMVLRFSNREVDQEFPKVCRIIDAAVQNRIGTPESVSEL